MNIKEICKKINITYPTMQNFLEGKDKIKLSTFKALVSDEDKRALDAIIERTKNKIKRESGRRSVRKNNG